MARQAIDNPILNRPYAEPSRHWRFDETGVIVPEVLDGRRSSESWIPVPRPKKKHGTAVQEELALAHTVERRMHNDQVDQIRAELGVWRQRGHPGVTTTTRRLLDYWADPERDNPILFCQREAAETAIYLAEAAPKQGVHWVRNALAQHNAEHNAGLPRVAVKMATGAGKTIVMAMLIAWHTLNKAANAQDARFARRFLVVTPGITIRDRLRVLLPADEQNYYKLRDLVPSDLWGDLRRAEIVITNFHSFLLRTTSQGRGIASNTKAILTAGKSTDPFTETPNQMVTRVLRELSGAGRTGRLVVFNDEAHHCYLGRTTGVDGAATTEAALIGQDRREAKARNRDAGVWFSGLQHIGRKIGVKTVYDLSATPYFLQGSGFPEGYLFPWVVSDFSLLDAIESGVVKIPRVPVDDDSSADEVVYLNLWSRIGDELPKRVPPAALAAGQPLPAELEGALHSLYGNYAMAFARWEQADAARGETPPVFIVVCNNTTVSKMVYDFVAGYTRATEHGDVHVRGELALLSNYADDRLLGRPRTILVDSAQLESGAALSADFRKVAADEITAFQQQQATRTGRGADELDDAAVLREVMNTVGKKDHLGEAVRCVVSVSMLTEGWDANTVTHILGVRAFGSQLLCEQVVGRGLRRRSYAVDDNGFFEPEYAEVYGVPFSFIRVEPGAVDTKPARTPVRVLAMEDREESRIVFPKLDGYRVEIPDEDLFVEFAAEHRFRLTLEEVATRVRVAGVIGLEEEHNLDELRSRREQQVAYLIAKRMLERHQADPQGQPRRWLFPRLVEIAQQWLREAVDYDAGAFVGLFGLAEMQALAAERINQAVFKAVGARDERVLPVFKRFDAEGSTDVVDFFSTKAVYETEPKKCPVNFVVLDGVGGNTWEQIVAQALELLPGVAAYVKNDHLEFAIPYVHGGRTRRYLPDFVVRLVRRPDDVVRHLVVEVSGTRKSAAMTTEKAETARNLWCAAVNNSGAYGRWGFVEVTEPTVAKPQLREAIELLYAGAPIIGLPG